MARGIRVSLGRGGRQNYLINPAYEDSDKENHLLVPTLATRTANEFFYYYTSLVKAF